MKHHRTVLTLQVPGRTGFVNIKEEVAAPVRASGVQEGLCLVNTLPITSSVFIHDEEPGLKQDHLRWLEKRAPLHAGTDPAQGGDLHNQGDHSKCDARYCPALRDPSRNALRKPSRNASVIDTRPDPSRPPQGKGTGRDAHASPSADATGERSLPAVRRLPKAAPCGHLLLDDGRNCDRGCTPEAASSEMTEDDKVAELLRRAGEMR